LTRRRIGHLRPRYLYQRALLLAYELRHPDAPWLTAQAIEVLRTALRPTDRGLEWGSGRSTVWLASRTAALLSIESSSKWFAFVSAAARERGLTNLDYRFVGADEQRGASPAYVSVASELEPGSLDYVLVDGLYRAECATAAVPLVKPGGILIVDDAERYLPLGPELPDATHSPPTSEWRSFRELVRMWRLIWTSDGVTGTALWIRAE
jgi:predicted O-methyltransferase YrrM